MAHELDMTTGEAAIAYVGNTPWHGLGERIDPNADIETWRRVARLDWQILRARATYTPEGTAELLDAPQRVVLYRSDSHAALSVMSDRFQIVQPGDVLEFFRDLVNAGGFKLHTAGALREGKTIWALAEIGESACIVGRDRVDGFLLLSTACDGTAVTSARFTTVRVVCANTLAAAVGNEAAVKVPHSRKFDASAVKAEMGIATGVFSSFIASARELAKVNLSDADAGKVVANVLMSRNSGYADPDNKLPPIDQSRGYQTVMNLFQGQGLGSTMPGAEGTAWGVLNAFTEYVDRHTRARSQDTRLSSAWFGDGAGLKDAAREALLAL